MDSWVGKTCPYCQAPLKPGAAVVLCGACGMPHHHDCWEENGRCTTYGCSGAPMSDPPGEASLRSGGHIEFVLRDPATLICPRCHAFNPPDQLFCRQCELPLFQSGMRNLWYIRRILLVLGGIIALLCIWLLVKSRWYQHFIPSGSVCINPKDGAELVQVPAGEFIMGDIPGVGGDDGHPQHLIYLDTYYIYKCAVTVAQYKAFCKATWRAMPDEPFWGWHDDHPIVNVSWNDAQAYADWAGAALPTEAQWEKAARGTDGRQYPWGNSWDAAKCVNSVESNSSGTQPVGSCPAGASPCGALDMAGNVWQWCADWYQPDYYAASPFSNPTGPVTGDSRVLRGGSWLYVYPSYLRSAFRSNDYPTNRDYGYGFRCVITVR